MVRLGRKANRLTRTMGTAFAGCTFPGADAPLFTVANGQMGLGLGIHGEPGLRDTVHVRGNESATILSYFENPGQWMVHCHISEHSEKGMMADIVVGEPAGHSH